MRTLDEMAVALKRPGAGNFVSVALVICSALLLSGSTAAEERNEPVVKRLPGTLRAPGAINHIHADLRAAEWLFFHEHARYASLEELLTGGWLDSRAYGNELLPSGDRFRLEAFGGHGRLGWRVYVWPMELGRYRHIVPATYCFGQFADQESYSHQVTHLGYLGNPTGPRPGDGLVDENGAPISSKWSERTFPRTPETQEFLARTRAAAQRRGYVALGLAAGTGLLAGLLLPFHLLVLPSLVVLVAVFGFGGFLLCLVGLCGYAIGTGTGIASRHRTTETVTAGVLLVLLGLGLQLGYLQTRYTQSVIAEELQKVIDRNRTAAS